MITKLESRERRKRRIRKKVSGTEQRPRLSVFRSARHIYAQVIDDGRGSTLASASSAASEGGTKVSKTEAAKAVGAAIAKLCKDKGIRDVVFDRSGYMYHGRVRSLAEAAREAGLNF